MQEAPGEGGEGGGGGVMQQAAARQLPPHRFIVRTPTLHTHGAFNHTTQDQLLFENVQVGIPYVDHTAVASIQFSLEHGVKGYSSTIEVPKGLGNHF